MGLDVTYTVRALWRQRLYAGMVLVIMGVGLGANAVLAAVADVLYLRPLAYRDADRIALSSEVWQAGGVTAIQADATPVVAAFAAVGGYRTGEGTVLVGREPLRVRMAAVTASFFDVFRDAPLRGRTFAGEGAAGGHGVVIGERLASLIPEPAASIIVNGARMDVVGVMPASFEFPNRADVWIRHEDVGFAFYQGARYLRSVVLLKPGVTVDAARSALRALDVSGAADATSDALVPLRRTLHRDLTDKLLLSEWLAALLLGVSWVAVLHSQVLRLSGRTTEFSTRLALGAQPRHLIGLVWLESGLLYGGGALLALLLAVISSPAVSRLLPERLAQTLEVRASWVTVAATVGLALACACIAGMITAWKIRRVSGRIGAGTATSRTVDSHAMAPGGVSLALVGVQIALTTAAVVCTLLLWRSFDNVLRTEAGLLPSGLVAFRVEIPATLGERGRQVVPQIEAALREEPSVSAVGATSHLPLRDTGGFLVPVDAVGQPPGSAIPVHFRAVSPSYFATVGTRVLEGRALAASDDEGPRHIVINDRLARSLWPGQSAVGRLVRVPLDRQNPTAEIIGVVASVKHFGLTEDTEPELYAPIARGQLPVMTIVVKTAVPPETVQVRARALVRRVAPGVAAYDFVRVVDVISSSYRDRQVQSLVALLFATIGIIVASTTVFTVISLMLRTRGREVAIRMALGASRRAVLNGMARGAGLAAAVGLAGGIVMAWAAGAYLQSMLYQLESRDPWSFALASALVVVSALASTLEATRRCTRAERLSELR